MTMGAVYTFFNMEAYTAYSKSALFKSMWKTPIIDASTIKIEVHENLRGSALTHSMEPWPVSGGRMPLCQLDLKEAYLLIVKFRFSFTANPDIPNAEAMRTMMESGTEMWKGIKGLRTKDFTFREDANNLGYGFYVFTNTTDL